MLRCAQHDASGYFQFAGRSLKTWLSARADSCIACLAGISPRRAAFIGVFAAVQAREPSGVIMKSCPLVCHTLDTSSMRVPLKISSHSGELAAEMTDGHETALICAVVTPSLPCIHFKQRQAASLALEMDEMAQPFPPTAAVWWPRGPLGGGAKSRFCAPMATRAGACRNEPSMSIATIPASNGATGATAARASAGGV